MAQVQISAVQAALAAAACLHLGLLSDLVFRADPGTPPRDSQSPVPAHHAARKLDEGAGALVIQSSKTLPAGVTFSRSVETTLMTRLASFRARLLQDGAEARSQLRRRRMMLNRDPEWVALQRAVKDDLPTYLAYLQQPENEAICYELLSIVGPGFIRDGSGKISWESVELPPPIEEKWEELTRRGTAEQKLAVLSWILRCSEAGDPPLKPSLIESCLGLLSDGEPRLQAAALDLLRLKRPDDLENHLALGVELWRKSEADLMRLTCLSAFACVKTPAGGQLFVEKLGELLPTLASKGGSMLDDCLGLFKKRVISCPTEHVALYGQALSSAMRCAIDERSFLHCARAAFDLPFDQAAEVLARAGASASTDQVRARLQAALNRMAAGERNPHVLRKYLQ